MSNSVRPHRQQPTRLPVPGILQARTLEWVAISFSNAWKWKVKVKSLSHVQLLATPWTAAYQVPLPMGFSRQEYWSGVPLPSPWGSWKGSSSNESTRLYVQGLMKARLWLQLLGHNHRWYSWRGSPTHSQGTALTEAHVAPGTPCYLTLSWIVNRLSPENTVILCLLWNPLVFRELPKVTLLFQPARFPWTHIIYFSICTVVVPCSFSQFLTTASNPHVSTCLQVHSIIRRCNSC